MSDDRFFEETFFALYRLVGKDALSSLMREEIARKNKVDEFTCTLYRCGVCRGSKTKYEEHRNRAGDEGATIKIECECGNKWNVTQS